MSRLLWQRRAPWYAWLVVVALAWNVEWNVDAQEADPPTPPPQPAEVLAEPLEMDAPAETDSETESEAVAVTEVEAVSEGKTDTGDSSAEVAVGAGEVDDATQEPALQLPAMTPDGRPFRSVGVYLSQLVELIPDHYVPIALSQLRDAEAKSQAVVALAETAQIRSAHYIVRLRGDNLDTLISDRSTIDIQYSGSSVIEQPLGKVNLAIDPLPTRSVVTNDSLPRFESHSDGSLSAFVDGDSQLSFVWSLRGTQRGLAREFDLRIPRSPQTLINLATPRGVMLETLDGVLWQLPTPPPAANLTESDPDSQWWRIDAGGLNQVRLKVRTIDESLDSEAIIVRRSSSQYEIDPGGVNWTCRMTVQFPARETYPPLVVRGATILAVSVDTVDVPIKTLVRNGDTQIVELAPPNSASPRSGTTATVNINGFCTWDEASGWCDLPMPLWLAPRVIHVASTTQSQLQVTDPMQLVSWQLPSTWKREFSDPQVAPLTSESTSTVSLIQAEGPPPNAFALSQADDTLVTQSDSYETITAQSYVPWSRVRLATRPPMSHYESTIAFRFGEGLFEARALVAVTIDPTRLEPLVFRLQKNWNLMSMSLPNSGRLIETLSVDQRTNTVTMWPEPEDVIDGRIVVEAIGTHRPPTIDRGITIPSSWFLRVNDLRGTMTVAMVPPPTLKWSGETTMRIARLTPDALKPEQTAFLGNLSPDTLLFRPELMKTPVLVAQLPSVSFNLTSRLDIRRDGDEWVETLELDTDAANPLLTSLNITTGRSQGRPPFRWLLRSSTESEPVSLPISSVVFTEDDSTGNYRLDFSNRDLRGKTLLGRRRYPAPEKLEIDLPHVLEASSQNAELIIDGGIKILDRSPTVMRVPVLRTEPAAGPVLTETSTMMDVVASPQATTDIVSINGDDSGNRDTDELRDVVRFRYDPVDDPSVVLAISQADPNVNLVFHKNVRVVASSRGTDAIEMSLSVSATEPIVVHFSPELHLTGVYRDSTLLSELQETPTSVSIGSSSDRQSLRILWTRNQSFQGWWRRCRIPRIDVNGVVVSERATLVASADSFIPASLWLATNGREFQSESDVQPESRRLVMHHNVALALGWWFSLCTFSICWWIARRSASVVAAMVMLAVTVAILWAPWSVAIIGWLILPASAAVLLATSVEYHDWLVQNRRNTTRQSTYESRGTVTQADSVHRGRDASFSVGGTQAFWWILSALLTWSVSISSAQDATPPNSGATGARTPPRVQTPASAAVTMLVPVDAEGKPVGDKVYVPESVQASLRRTPDQDAPQDVRFQFADYRIKIEPTRDTTVVTPPAISAEYVVRVDRPTSKIVLPLRSDSVRRVELVGLDDDRIVRFVPRDDQSIIVTVPPANLFRLRLTLIANVDFTTQGTQVDLAVPKINSARLTVDLDRGIDSVSIDGAAGRIVSESGRSVADLGPVSRIVLRYVTRDRVEPTAGQSIASRYWVHCGQEQTSVDCEITPQSPILQGQQIQIVVFDSAMPTLSSPAWRMIANEMISPMRRQLTLVSLSDTPTPIRMLWTLPSQINEPDKVDERIAMSVPEVGLVTPSLSKPIWVAIHTDPELRVITSNRVTIEPLAPDLFLAGWVGYRDQIDQSFIAYERVPPLVLVRSDAQTTSVASRHHLQVATTDLQLHYRAVVTTGDGKSQSRSLRIPRGVELLSLSINGNRIDAPVIQFNGQNEVVLGSLPKSNPVEITAIAATPLSAGGRFTPPRFEMLPPCETRDTYTLSRDSTTRVKTITPSPLANVDAIARQTALESRSSPTIGPVVTRPSDAELLAAGWIPVSTWQIDETADQAKQRLESFNGDSASGRRNASVRLPGGVFEASAQSNRFSTNQLIALSWQDGRWSMETHIEIAAGNVPDFVDVELPTRWCESLEVLPPTTWSRQPSTDPALQVIRIQCDSASKTDSMLTIRGQLKSSDKGRIAVPAVSVLGGGRRRIFVAVPARLTNELIAWRTSAVLSSVELPATWQQVLASNGNQRAVTQRSTYAASGPGWSIELTSLPREKSNATITGRETQVYLSDSSALVLSRWDLVPAGLTSINVELPKDASVVATWTANRAVSVVQTPGSPRVEVPLSLDRLSQSVEVLYRLPTPRPSNDNYVAQIVDLSQPAGWVSVYALTPSRSSDAIAAAAQLYVPGSSEVLPTQVFALAQASSIVESVERSFDDLAERPADEVSTWLIPWIQRYTALCATSGRGVSLASLMESAETRDLATAPQLIDTRDEREPNGIDRLSLLGTDEMTSDTAERITAARWQDLDRRIGVFVERFISGDETSSVPIDQVVSRLDVLGFDGFTRISLARVPGNQSPPDIRWPTGGGTAPLRLFIANCLTVLLVVAMIVLVWRFRTYTMPIVHHPAIWLGVIAICCFFLAPTPIAASLLIVAIILPMFPRHQQSSDMT